jgi:hypothetical protein
MALVELVAALLQLAAGVRNIATLWRCYSSQRSDAMACFSWQCNNAVALRQVAITLRRCGRLQRRDAVAVCSATAVCSAA